MQYQFPKNFYWGSATSGPQSEGYGNKAHDSIWDEWFKLEPNRFFKGIGPDKTADFFNCFKTDIQFLKKTGHNSFRTSLQWSRLIKNLETGEADPVAVAFYNQVIDDLIAEGIEPFMALFHFDMPLELQKQGGWENRRVVDLFNLYAQTAFKLFGDRVKHWFTFNEPIVVAECGYLYQYHYPCVVNFKKMVQVAYHLNLASSLAVQSYHKINQDGEIGIVLNLSPSYPRDPNNKADADAAHLADLISNRSFLDPAIKGEFDQALIDFVKKNDLATSTTEADLQIIKENTIDFLGVNYYQPRRIKCKEEAKPAQLMPESFFDNYIWPDRKMNPHRGWEIYYKGLYDIGINLKENYGNIRWMVTENGMGVEGEEKFIVNSQVQDDYRIEFVTEHLKELHRAIQEGSNCVGYHMWCFIDSWSWLNAFKNRYGFVSLDLTTGKKTVKKSGEWYKQMTANNGF